MIECDVKHLNSKHFWQKMEVRILIFVNDSHGKIWRKNTSSQQPLTLSASGGLGWVGEPVWFGMTGIMTSQTEN